MINFLNLKTLNQKYSQELNEACKRVIDSGWYIMGDELENRLKGTLQNIVGLAIVLVWLTA